ncbi:MAG: hypothetical protein KF723_01290 [Rhizobiaceae bacterium]|nr:hypothetical protein [Rhizobiaceae bacterium]
MSIRTTLRQIMPRATILLGLLALPLVAMPVVNAGEKVTIEAPSPKKMGAGLVIMVSLQRAQ